MKKIGVALVKHASSLHKFKILKNGRIIESFIPGKFAGHRPRKIFGRLDCTSGIRKMHKKNRVFFHSWEDAIREGYRPCRVCKPKPGD